MAVHAPTKKTRRLTDNHLLTQQYSPLTMGNYRGRVMAPTQKFDWVYTYSLRCMEFETWANHWLNFDSHPSK